MTSSDKMDLSGEWKRVGSHHLGPAYWERLCEKSLILGLFEYQKKEVFELAMKECFRYRVWPKREFQGQTERVSLQKRRDTQLQPTLFRIGKEGLNHCL